MNRSAFLSLGLLAPLAKLFGIKAPAPAVRETSLFTAGQAVQWASDSGQPIAWTTGTGTYTDGSEMARVEGCTMHVRVTVAAGPSEWRTEHYYQCADGTWLWDKAPEMRFA